MNKTFFQTALPTFALAAAMAQSSDTAPAAAALAAGASWDPGAPVVTYWYGPGCCRNGRDYIPLDDFWARQLKEGGFNTVWATRPEELDMAANYGFRVIYALDPETVWAKFDPDDEASMAKLAARVNAVKDHPALYVYQHWDEPGADKFPMISRVADVVRGLDPAHALWINLLPTYANNAQLGIGGEGKDDPKRMGFLGDRLSSYWEYVRLFCETYRPRLLTYDHYQFKANGDSHNYFMNLGIARLHTAAFGIPLWNGVQACSWTPGSLASPPTVRVPNVDEMRYLAMSTAAYGAHGLYWYAYCRKNHMGCIAELDGTVGEKYEGLKAVHRDFLAYATALRGMNFVGAYFQGVHPQGGTPYGPQALLKISPETPYSEFKPLADYKDTTLVSRFDAPGRPTHLMVVNCDYRQARTLSVAAPRPAERLDPATGQWHPVGTDFELTLDRGGGALLRLAD